MPRQSKPVKQNYMRPGIGGYDDRKGLGYGQLDTEDSYMSSAQFPYETPDIDLDDVDVDLDDDEIDKFVKRVNTSVTTKDSYSSSRSDAFQFVGGKTKLGEIFSTTSLGVKKNSISPMPQLYKKRGPALGGTEKGSTRVNPSNSMTRSMHGGNKKAWAGANVVNKPDNPAYKLEDIIDDEDDNINDVRDLVSMIIYQQKHEGS